MNDDDKVINHKNVKNNYHGVQKLRQFCYSCFIPSKFSRVFMKRMILISKMKRNKIHRGQTSIATNIEENDLKDN